MTEPKTIGRCSVCNKPLRKCRHCGATMGCSDIRSHGMHFATAWPHDEAQCGRCDLDKKCVDCAMPFSTVWYDVESRCKSCRVRFAVAPLVDSILAMVEPT